MASSHLNKVLINFGRLLMLASLAYFVLKLVPHTHDIWVLLKGQNISGYLLSSLFVYCLALIVLSQLWLLLLRLGGGDIEPARLAHTMVYLLTIVAKYLPGNVFQYATRHAFTKKLGLSHKTVALAAVSELALLSITAVLLSIIVIMVFMEPLDFAQSWPWSGWQSLIRPVWMFAIFVAVLGLSVLVAHFVFSGVAQQKIKWVISSYLTASAFFIINFISLWLVAQLFLDTAETDLVSLAAYLFVGNLIAWLVGMMTPGAPGGLGVKEFVFLAFLSPFVGEPQALGIAVASRLISLAGDCLVSFGAYLRTTKHPY